MHDYSWMTDGELDAAIRLYTGGLKGYDDGFLRELELEKRRRRQAESLKPRSMAGHVAVVLWTCPAIDDETLCLLLGIDQKRLNEIRRQAEKQNLVAALPDKALQLQVDHYRRAAASSDEPSIVRLYKSMGRPYDLEREKRRQNGSWSLSDGIPSVPPPANIIEPLGFEVSSFAPPKRDYRPTRAPEVTPVRKSKWETFVSWFRK